MIPFQDNVKDGGLGIEDRRSRIESGYPAPYSILDPPSSTSPRSAPTFGVPDYGPTPSDMPIPDRFNLFLVVLVCSGGIALLWLGSQVTAWYAVVLIGVVFSYLMLTNYALLHEAAHGNLNSNSRVDIVEGAWNLWHVPWMSWLLLHGERDLNHHRRPDVSWYYLPRLSPPGEPRMSYWRQYWRQWLGPRPCREPEPRRLR
jgi:fatty acid desaturase